MAHREVSVGDQRHHVSGTTALYASVAGVAVGGTLLGMMGFSFLASVTLLLIASPLLIIFSPLVFFAACVLVAAVAGFAAATTLGLAGLHSIEWVFRSFGGRNNITSARFDGGGVTETMAEAGEKVEGHSPEENRVNRG